MENKCEVCTVSVQLTTAVQNSYILYIIAIAYNIRAYSYIKTLPMYGGNTRLL